MSKLLVPQGHGSAYWSFSLILAWILYRERPATMRAADYVMLGEEALIALSTREGGETVEVLAKVDTGAGYSSIDKDLAKDLGIDLEDPEDEVKIDFANGKKTRPLVRVRIKMAGKTLNTVSRWPTAASSPKICCWAAGTSTGSWSSRTKSGSPPQIARDSSCGRTRDGRRLLPAE
jgi:hypothetical protein